MLESRPRQTDANEYGALEVNREINSMMKRFARIVVPSVFGIVMLAALLILLSSMVDVDRLTFLADPEPLRKKANQKKC